MSKKTIDEMSKRVNEYLERLSSENFTGKTVFTFNMNDGGIAKTEVEIKHDLMKWKKE